MSLYDLARPLLFRMDPETAHARACGALALAGRFGWTRELLASKFVARDPSLQVELAGLRFPNPVGLAAGYDKDCLLTHATPCLGFGFIEAGTVTPRPQRGNAAPRLFRIPECDALLNRMGFNNHGARAAAEALTEAGRASVPLGINIGMNADTPPERAHKDYAEAFEVLRGFGDYFVVNVSSPNTGGLRQLQSRLALERILTEIHIRNKEKKPVFVKLAPEIETEQLSSLIPLLLAEAAGLIISNTTTSRQDVPPRWATEPGGVSGAPVRERSTRLIAEAYRVSRGRIPIIGSGGIFTAEDAWRKISAGASLVQVYTGLVYRGPGLAREINEGLVRLLRQNGVARIADAVGRSQPEAVASMGRP